MNITLYALCNYNCNKLVPKTFDLDDYENRDEYLAAVQAWLATVPYPHEPGRFEEEWIVADWDDIPDQFVGTYDIHASFWHYLEKRRDVHDSQREAFDEFYNLFISGDDLPDLRDAYLGHFDSKIEFVEYWLIECNGMKQFPPNDMCIDYETTEMTICTNHGICESNGYYFYMI